ncbi:MAG TPA: RIO1 family regulatory kinase/ATPase [Ktedonobacteraceae bacterium]|nr:RIO1 family regulatory kinase/ATPase [Ktedonobacteraceae bacterium]
MDIHTDFEPEDVETQTEHGSIPLHKQKKASYESNADVQRWLKEQAVEEGGSKPEFHPSFLASLRDAPWIISSLAQFYEEDLISDVLHVVKSGKEATVYCCAADPRTGADYLAAKVYRPRMFRSLKNDAMYRQSRTQFDRDGKVVRGRGLHHSGGKHNGRDRAAQISSWIEYEFQTQRLLYDRGVDVPEPVAQIGNAVLMEYIGSVDQPASTLREVTLTKEEARPLFNCIMRNVESCLSYNRVHGDLSEYNILYWQGAVTVIDFAQAVDPRHNRDVFTLLARDIERVCRYFARYGVIADAQELAITMWTQYQGGCDG